MNWRRTSPPGGGSFLNKLIESESGGSIDFGKESIEEFEYKGTAENELQRLAGDADFHHALTPAVLRLLVLRR